MKQMLKLVGALLLICVVAGLLLAKIYGMTKEPIAAARLAAKTRAVKTVLPDCENNPMETVIVPADTTFTNYVATRNGGFVGSAFESVSKNGYGGDIKVMIGVDAKDNVYGIEILTPMLETPGLGAKIKDEDFRDRFKKPVSGTVWKVSKDGGAIDAITAATISSRAVAEAVDAGLTLYKTHKHEILKELSKRREHLSVDDKNNSKVQE